MIELQKLLDNGWDILCFKQVDGNYCAAAKRKHREQWKDLFECVNNEGVPVNFPLDEFEHSQGYGARMPHRIAAASTPEAAFRQLVEQVLHGAAKS